MTKFLCADIGQTFRMDGVKMIFLMICFLVVLVDFFVKRWAEQILTKIETMPLWQNVFHLTYVENSGAAFGMFKNGRFVFIALTIIIVLGIIWFIIKNRKKDKLLNLWLSFIAGGAVGNLIDRIWLGYVVDLFDFRFINFPVFNVADIFVCIGAFLVVVYFLINDDKTKDIKEDCGNNDNNCAKP